MKAGRQPSDTDEAVIVRGVLRLARALRRSVPVDEVSGGALSLLVALNDGGPQSAVALASSVGLQPQSLSRLLARLETEGLIRRSVDPADRRRHVIVPTDAGLVALGRAMHSRRQWLASTLADGLDTDERETLVRAARLMLRIATDGRTREEHGG